MQLLRFSRSLAVVASLPLFVACSYGDHHRGGHYYDDGYGQPPPSPDVTIEQATIDTDETLDVDPGVGAGAFIEYASGGTYRITTSCDAANGDCYWDIVVTPLDRATLQSVAPIDLESDDSVSLGGNQARLVAFTTSDFDGFTLETEPGAAIEVDALLDNGAANRYLFWVGDGALHSGAPSNPVDLIPSEE